MALADSLYKDTSTNCDAMISLILSRSEVSKLLPGNVKSDIYIVLLCNCLVNKAPIVQNMFLVLHNLALILNK